MRNLLICDMDGTVIDSMPFLRALAISLAGAEGCDRVDFAKHYDETMGAPINMQFGLWNTRYLNSTIDIMRLTRAYEDIHQAAAPLFYLTEFGIQLLTRPKENWIRVLVSSTHESIVHSMSRIGDLQFDFVGGRRAAYTKERQIRDCLAKYPVKNVVYVGDAKSDEQIALDLKIPFIWASDTTFSEVNELFP